jgi:hypothetical protein
MIGQNSIKNHEIPHAVIALGCDSRAKTGLSQL